MSRTPITVAYGDGIGPEIMDATLAILDRAGAQLDIETVRLGEKVFLEGNPTGIEDAAWDSMQRTRVLLKGPITTPQGGGYKSINVTLRKSYGLYANVRPCVSYHPFVPTKHPFMNLTIIRENEEDVYAGIEHRQTHDTYQCLKLVTRRGCERIVRYAFEYARTNNRRKVTCFTKDNIMKLTDGLFHQVFDEIGKDYPELTRDHKIVDIGAAKLAARPEMFDVIVMPNLYGDILSDVAAEIAGSVGLAGSANIGDGIAMFEAIHGSAPDIAGQNVANPSGLLHGAVMMLVHIGQSEVAERIHNAWLRTIEDGVHTVDILSEETSKRKVGTKKFSEAVVERLGLRPRTLESVSYRNMASQSTYASSLLELTKEKKETVGVDIFVHWPGNSVAEIAGKMQGAEVQGVKLKAITNRGIKVWPEGSTETLLADHWRCRFMAETKGGTVSHQQIVAMLGRLAEAGLDFIKTENLCTFDGVEAFSSTPGK